MMNRWKYETLGRTTEDALVLRSNVVEAIENHYAAQVAAIPTLPQEDQARALADATGMRDNCAAAADTAFVNMLRDNSLVIEYGEGENTNYILTYLGLLDEMRVNIQDTHVGHDPRKRDPYAEIDNAEGLRALINDPREA